MREIGLGVGLYILIKCDPIGIVDEVMLENVSIG